MRLIVTLISQGQEPANFMFLAASTEKNNWLIQNILNTWVKCCTVLRVKTNVVVQYFEIFRAVIFENTSERLLL